MNKTVKIVISLLLCIPLFLAIYFSVSINLDIPTDKSLTYVGVTTPEGEEFYYTDKKDLGLYLSAVTDSKKVEKAVRDISTDVPATVTYNEPTESYQYSFYISKDLDECYCIDSNGNIYKLSHKLAEAFLARSEFAYIYENSHVPKATLSASDKVVNLVADEYEWQYKIVDGSFFDGTTSGTSDDSSLAYNNNDELALDFEIAPDTVEVTVVSGGQTVHSGSFEELSGKINAENDTVLSCEIKATWYELDGRDFHGSATYNTNLLYDVPATYSFVDKALSLGEFTIIKFNNLNDGEKVTLETDLLLPELTVHNNDGNKFMFVPIDVSATPGTYDIKVVMDSNEGTTKFTVRNKDFGSITIADRNSESRSDSLKKEYDQHIEKLSSYSVTQRLWDDTEDNFKFVSPVRSVEGKNFGAEIHAAGLSTKFRQVGLDLEAAEGTNVVATAKGMVVYAARLGYTGNTVVIDHGFNVLSIYQNLSSISVSVGDTVDKGAVIGTTGTTGDTTTARTRFAMYMEGIYINPRSNYTYGIKISN